jgi:hypothetical protein
MNPDDPLDPEMIAEVEAWRPDGPPLSSEARLWLVTHYPDRVRMRVNKEWFEAEIKRLKEAGVEITPDTFKHMGIKLQLSKKFRPKGEGWTVLFGEQ